MHACIYVCICMWEAHSFRHAYVWGVKCHAFIHTHTHTYRHICDLRMYVPLDAHIVPLHSFYTYAHTYIRMYTHACMRLGMYIPLDPYVHRCVAVALEAIVNTRTHMHTYIHTHARRHVYLHTYIHDMYIPLDVYVHWCVAVALEHVKEANLFVVCERRACQSKYVRMHVCTRAHTHTHCNWHATCTIGWFVSIM